MPGKNKKPQERKQPAQAHLVIPPQKWVSPAQARAQRGLQPENSSASIGEAPGGLSALPLRSVLQAAGAKASQAGLLLSWAQPDARTTNTSSAWFFVVQSQSLSDSLQPHGLQHPGFPVLNHLPEFAQTHVHRAGDAIQPSHPLSAWFYFFLFPWDKIKP